MKDTKEKPENLIKVSGLLFVFTEYLQESPLRKLWEYAKLS